MERVIATINAVLWGIPVLLLILMIGSYLSIFTGFAQIRLIPTAIGKLINNFKSSPIKKDGTTMYRALCTALAATVGTGNIAGVAGAISLGGPGTIFWMWLCAVLGMITKMAEVTLAQRYRVKNEIGEFVGGPMYTIRTALPRQYAFLAYIYAFFGVVAALGIGNATQVNAVMDGIKNLISAGGYQLDNFGLLIIGGILIVLIYCSFRAGANGVGSLAEKLVPFASGVYIILCVAALIVHHDHIYPAVYTILIGAFNPKSATCGFIGSIFLVLRIGASRGVFTNEAGMGTAAIIHASAEVDHPVEQGLMGIMEVFLDTIVICTLTALVILCSGVCIPFGTDPGIALTMDAFACVLGEWSRLVIAGLVCIFAFATILGWGVYGMRCAQFIFGDAIWKKYVLFQILAAILGIVLRTSLVWMFAEIVNGLMAIPNIIMLFYLSPEFFKLLSEYSQKERTE